MTPITASDVLRGLFLLGGVVLCLASAGAFFLYSSRVKAKERAARRVDAVARALGTRSSMEKVPAEASERVFRLPIDKPQAREAAELARRLRSLGISQRWAGSLFLSFRLALGLFLAGLLLVLSARFGGFSSPFRVFGLFVFGIAAGWYVPAVALDALGRRRLKEIERGLPEAIELLIIAVEAGLALEDGISRIVGELKRSRPAMAEELALTAADLKILPDRELALDNFARRIGTESVRSVTATLAQTLRYGTPLAQALHVSAGELRNEALARLEERANRMPVLLTIPMVAFILPAVFILVGGPAFLQVLNTILR